MAKTNRNTWILAAFVLSACLYAAFFFARPINLATADLGRHIINGELIANGLTDVLYQNHYSFTEPDFPFVNHHWGSGLVFYHLHNLFGFNGLSVLYVLLSVLALALMVGAGKKENWPVRGLVALSVVSLFAYRVEVRPEGFSYALMGLYYFLFSRFRDGGMQLKYLLPVLLVIQVLWVNLHIFFFFGMLIAGSFMVAELINGKRDSLKPYLMIIGGLILVSLINPHLHKGLLAPLTIFNEYGYMVAENQTLAFMHERFGNPELFHFELFGLVSIILVIFAVVKKMWKPIMAELLLVLLFGVLSVVAVRGIPMFALFFIPFASSLLLRYLDGLHFKTRQTLNRIVPVTGIVFCLLFTALKGTYASARDGYEGIGLVENIERCGNFMRSQQIPGKVFNNYDIGSYLIYYLYDREKVFVDNRPEAYSVAFFDSIYKPMQEDELVWKTKSIEFGINTICFYRHDNTPWAQPFLIERTKDPDWIPIYVDDASIILVRNSEANLPWIKKFALPREMFTGVPTK